MTEIAQLLADLLRLFFAKWLAEASHFREETEPARPAPMKAQRNSHRAASPKLAPSPSTLYRARSRSSGRWGVQMALRWSVS